MSDLAFYKHLSETSLNGDLISKDDALQILEDPELDLLALLQSAYQVRSKYFGKEVMVHVLNNAQNGHCPEDCGYCAQAKTSDSKIADYPLKSDDEIMAEAKSAYESGAHRYCMVSGGRGPSPKRVEKLAQLITDIKAKYPLEICVSAGLLGEEAALTLKNAGLDRLNHNLNTSKSMYPKICSTHTYEDRINTLKAAQKARLNVCSGLIAGLGEDSNDLWDIATELRSFEAPSIPVNFLIPIEGNALTQTDSLTPQYCLRVLCLFRFINPRAEIRVAAGREGHLRSLESMSLYPANSLFLEGYLNTKGHTHKRTLRMITDAGFHIKSDFDIKDILEGDDNESDFSIDGQTTIMKTLEDLKPTVQGS